MELFRISSDPDEQSDLATLQPEQRRRLEGLVSSRVAPRDPRDAPEIPDDELDAMRALGYVD